MLSRPIYRRLVLLLCLTLVSSTARAQTGGTPWRFAPANVASGVFTDEDSARLRERYPLIQGPENLENLLEEISRNYPLNSLAAHFEDGAWVISAKAAKLIADVEVDTVTRFMHTPLSATAQNFIGQVDSSELRSKIEASLADSLRRKGYPLARVGLTVEPNGTDVTYVYDIKEGEPCVLDRIELGFKLPQGAKLDLKTGDLCDVEVIERAVSDLDVALRDRGYNQLRLELAEISYHRETNTATVLISGVLGQKIRYEVIDQQRRFLIDDLFADEELTKIDPSLISPDSMAAELMRRYRNRGFLDVEVKGPEVSRGGEDEFIYVFRVEPGTQYFLRGIVFEGNTVFTPQELLDTMNLDGFLQRSPPYNPEDIQTGLNAIRGRYQSKGYWDIRVRDPGMGQKDKDTSTVRMAIQLEEGQQRVLAELKVNGNHALSTEEIRDLFKGSDEKPISSGDPLDRAKLVDLQQQVRTAYLNRGYLYAEIDIELQASQQRRQVTATVIVNVKEGPRVKVGDIAIIGLVRTDSKVVRREILFEPGAWYDPEKITQSRQALTQLGLFRSVQIVPADRNAISQRQTVIDLVVDVREGKAGSITFGPGWSLAKGWSYETEAAYSNLGGVGRQISLRGAISEERNQEAISNKTLVGRKIGAGYVEPWVFDLPLDASISATQKAEWGGELWELSFGGELALRHKLRNWKPGSVISTFYGQKLARTEGPRRVEDALLANDVRIGQMGARYNLDERDNLRFPTDGYTLDSELAWARYPLGGDLQYFRWDVTSSIYFGILSDLVFAINANLTSYEGIERKGEAIDILPPSERLYAGGSESVRGYRPRTLGPVVRTPMIEPSSDGGCRITGYDYSQLDGVRRTVLKTELRYRVNDQFAVTGFVDSGNVFFTKNQMKQFEHAYSSPVNTSELDPSCAGIEAYRSVEDNVGYDFEDLVSNPGYLWSRHYSSYGLATSLLTALGSVNLGYGLPWHEPTTERCAQSPEYCYRRGKQGSRWLTRGEFYLNVGARF